VPGSSKLAAPAVHRLYDRSEIRPGLVLRRQMCPSASIGPKRAADRGRRLARAIQAPARGLVTKPDVLSRNVPNPPHVASMPERNSRGSRRAGPRGSRWVEPQGADNPPGNASPETYGGLCVPGVENPPHTGRGGNYGGLCPQAPPPRRATNASAARPAVGRFSGGTSARGRSPWRTPSPAWT
jgi:hypothetical protein